MGKVNNHTGMVKFRILERHITTSTYKNVFKMLNVCDIEKNIICVCLICQIQKERGVLHAQTSHTSVRPLGHLLRRSLVLFDFINLTQMHNFTVSAQDIFSLRRHSVLTVSFTGILQVLMQIMKRFIPSY